MKSNSPSTRPPATRIDDIRFLRIREVAERLGVCRRHVYRMVAAGRFPAPGRFGRCAVWRESDVAAWQRSIFDAEGEG